MKIEGGLCLEEMVRRKNTSQSKRVGQLNSSGVVGEYVALESCNDSQLAIGVGMVVWADSIKDILLLYGKDAPSISSMENSLRLAERRKEAVRFTKRFLH